MSAAISEKTFKFCTTPASVSSELAKEPSKSPGDIAKTLYGSHSLETIVSHAPSERKLATKEELDRALQCGNFSGTQPSELFLRAYHDVLCSLEHDPIAGVVSPSLLGSTGVVPLTMIGPIMDIVRHMSNLIVRAEKEVLLATQLLERLPSVPAHL